MNIKNRIASHCKYLRLNTIGEQIQSLADNAAKEGISYLDFAARMLDVEIEHRQDREMLNKIRIARLPVNHDLKHYDCTAVEGMPVNRLEQLKELTWLDQNFSLVIMGPNGIGKTMRAAGLCYHAIKTGYRAYFRTM